MDVERVAVASVGVGKQRDGRARGERAARLQVLIEGENAAVGEAQQALGKARAADRGGLVAVALDESDAIAVEHAWQYQDVFGFNQRSKGAAINHGMRP